MIVQRFNLNLIPNQSPVIVHVNQYDTGTGRLIATLYEGNEPYSPNGTAVIQGTKPDGHGFQYTATLDGNVVTADLTEQMAPVAGDVRAQIVVTESSGVTGTFAFIMRVQPSALPSDTDMSESDYQYIEEAIREAQEAVQTAQEATETAQEAVERAEAAITETQENAEDSEAWAQGTRGGIPVEPTDPTYEHNAEYWAQYAERYAQGGLHYKNSIPFADIPTTGMREGDMYNITDDFTTDSRFEEGAGIEVKGGTNIAWNSDNKWDVLALPPKTTFNGRSGSILPMAGDYDSKKILLSSALHIGGETQNDVQEALEALSNDGVKFFNGRSGSILPMAGDYDSEKILLTSVLHIGGETQENVQKALEALSDDGVKSFNGRSGSVLPMAGDYSAEQVNYDNNQTVKEKIDALVTKEASDIAGQQSLLKDTVGWTAKNLLQELTDLSSASGVTFTKNSDGSITTNGSATARVQKNFASQSNTHGLEKLIGKEVVLSGCPVGGTNATYRLNAYFYDGTHQLSYNDVGEGIAFTFPDIKNTYTQWNIKLDINAGGSASVDVSGKVFYPMLRKADITDPTYEPYHESVEVMYEEEIHGVNLADSSMANIGIAWNGATNSDRARLVIPCSPNTEYIASINGTNAMSYIGYVTSPTIIPSQTSLINFVSPASITTGANDRYIIIGFAKTGITQANVDALKFMLRLATIDDSTYRPYNPQAIQNQLNARGVLGAKNFLNPTYAGGTVNGVTITANENKTYELNGAPSSGNMAVAIYTGTFPVGRYILNGVPDFTTYGARLHIRETAGASQVDAIDTGKGIEFTIPSATTSYSVFMYLNSGYTANNLIIKPMIRLASDPDDTYQPYAMTNKELTEKRFEKRILSSGDDLNNITETGIYHVATSVSNVPENRANLTLIVNGFNSTQIRQVLMTKEAMYTRSKEGATWSSWYKFTGTVVS